MGRGVANVWQNTFLFDEDVLLQQQQNQSSQLCKPQDEAYTLACPAGFDSPSLGPGSAAEGIECALEGRARLLRLTRDNEVVYAVVSPTTAASAQTARAMCVAPDADLVSFRIDCGASRLDRRRLLALDALFREPPLSAVWYARLGWLAYFRQTFYWYGTALYNPYQEPAAGQGRTVCTRRPGGGAALNAFRYSTMDHTGDGSGLPVGVVLPAEEGLSACIPCSGALPFGQAVCQLFVPRRHFRAAVCAAGVSAGGKAELTTAMVCSECEQTMADGTATLLPEEEGEAWWSVRQEEAAALRQRQFATTVDGVVVWGQIHCRYGCANGSTSNNVSPEAYRREPCIPCAAALLQMDPALACAVVKEGEHQQGVSAFLDAPEGQPPCGTAAAGETANFRPFKAVCVACEARLQQWGADKVPRYVFPPLMPKPATRAADCLALCNPSLYHSYDGSNSDVPLTAPVPFARLRCGACADQTQYSCQYGCVEGYYLNSSAGTAQKCLPCTATPCPADAGLYRERCPRGSASRDAQCVPCPSASEALQNSYEEDSGGDASSLLLRTAIREAAAAFTFNRRWLTAEELAGSPFAPIVLAVDSPHPEQCALACINNYAW